VTKVTRPRDLTLEIDAERAALEQPLESPTVQLVASQRPAPASATPVRPKWISAPIGQEHRGRPRLANLCRLASFRQGVQRVYVHSVLVSPVAPASIATAWQTGQADDPIGGARGRRATWHPTSGKGGALVDYRQPAPEARGAL
jgi:hypothetical protein